MDNEHMFEEEENTNPYSGKHTYDQGNSYGSSQTEQKEEWNQNPYENAQSGQGYNDNPYGNGYGGNHPYGGSKSTTSGKHTGIGYGIAALVLGLIALITFFAIGNIIPAVLAIIFGIVQLCRYEGGRGLAIGGIVTAILSLVLMVVGWALVFSNVRFIHMMERELMDAIGDEGNFSFYFDDDDDSFSFYYNEDAFDIEDGDGITDDEDDML